MISRRDFARTAGLAAGAALLPRRAAAADEPRKPPAPKAGSAPPQPSPAAQAEAEARVAAIVARYGARLSAADRAELLRQSIGAQAVLDELRAFTALEWSDEPAALFRAPRRR